MYGWKRCVYTFFLRIPEWVYQRYTTPGRIKWQSRTECKTEDRPARKRCTDREERKMRSRRSLPKSGSSFRTGWAMERNQYRKLSSFNTFMIQHFNEVVSKTSTKRRGEKPLQLYVLKHLRYSILIIPIDNVISSNHAYHLLNKYTSLSSCHPEISSFICRNMS